MGVAVGVLLHEDCPGSEERGISHEEEGFGNVRDGEDRGSGEELLEGVKCALLKRTPSPWLVLLGKGSEGGNDVRIVRDEFPVEVGKAKEGTNSLNGGGWFPSGDGGQFGGIHANKPLSYDYSEIFHDGGVKRAFRDLEG